MSCTKIIIWSAIFINDIWILANPHQNWIVHVWTAKDSWRTLEYSWNDYFGILPTAIIQDTSNFKANNHLNRNKSSVLKQYRLSYSFAFNGNSAFCFLGFAQLQNCSSLSSLALELQKELLATKYSRYQKKRSYDLFFWYLGMKRLVLDLLHAHRVSPKGLCPSGLNLFAIRTSLSL